KPCYEDHQHQHERPLAGHELDHVVDRVVMAGKVIDSMKKGGVQPVILPDEQKTSKRRHRISMPGCGASCLRRMPAGRFYAGFASTVPEIPSGSSASRARTDATKAI